MERSEPTFVPEWLKNGGNVIGGGTSAPRSDDQASVKSPRIKSSVNNGDSDIGRSSLYDKTTSSYFRRTSSSNGSSHLRSYGSFGRSHKDREWDKERLVFGDPRHRNHSDPLPNQVLSRHEKDGLRRSHSSVSGKHGDSWHRKVVGEPGKANKNDHNSINTVNKVTFERDFPTLGADETQAVSDLGRVPSPGLSTAIHSLPVGNSTVIGGDGWTSALAEVPLIVGGHGNGVASVQQPVNEGSVSVASNGTTGRNMAETLAQGPPRVSIAPQVSVGSQRLEELAVKQLRQLIPVTPSLPKPLTLEKAKPKIGQQQSQSSHLGNHSPRSGSMKPDTPKTSSSVNFHVLKPSRERNGISSSNGGKLPNSSPAIAPLAVGSASLKNTPVLASVERKPNMVILEKRLTPQARSRNEFFNSVRKNSMATSSSAVSDSSSSSPAFSLEKSSETESPPVSVVEDDSVIDKSSGDPQLKENKVDVNCNGDACCGLGESISNREKHVSSKAIRRYSEEEEAVFLRSLGWKEGNGEDEGLTEEEISGFYRDISKNLNSNPSWKKLQGAQPKIPM